MTRAAGSLVRPHARGCSGQCPRALAARATPHLPAPRLGSRPPGCRGPVSEGRPAGTLVIEARGRCQLSIPDFRTASEPISSRPAIGCTARGAGMVDALILGRRGGIDPELQDRFAWSGLVHLLVHLRLSRRADHRLGDPAGPTRSGSAGRARSCSPPRRASAYVGFLGWPAPATRAAALAVVIARCRLRQRHVQATPLLSATCLMVLLVDPWAILDLGGWLSAAALWGAATFSRWSDRALGRALHLADVRLVGRRHAGHRADHGGCARDRGAGRHRAQFCSDPARGGRRARRDRQPPSSPGVGRPSRERSRPAPA